MFFVFIQGKFESQPELEDCFINVHLLLYRFFPLLSLKRFSAHINRQWGMGRARNERIKWLELENCIYIIKNIQTTYTSHAFRSVRKCILHRSWIHKIKWNKLLIVHRSCRTSYTWVQYKVYFLDGCTEKHYLFMYKHKLN